MNASTPTDEAAFAFFQQVTGLCLPYASHVRRWKQEPTKGAEIVVTARHQGNSHSGTLRALELVIIETGGQDIMKLRYSPRNAQPFSAYIARATGDDVWLPAQPALALRKLYDLTGEKPTAAALALMAG